MHTSRRIAKLAKLDTRSLLAMLLAGLALGLGAMTAASSASAATGSLSGGASAGPPRGMCPITATATAEKNFNGYFFSGHVHTNVNIGPNQYLFVGCRYKVNVDLMTPFGVGQHFEHVATAGARFDPWGNQKWPSYDDSFDSGWFDIATSLRVTLDPIT